MDLFELNGRVVVNLSDALKAFDEIQKEGQKSESKLGKAFKAVGRGAAVAGKTIAAGLAAGGAAMGALTVKALNLSGELEQNMGGSEAVFKEYAASMQETARSAFENMGLSTSDFLGTANKMGALFQGAGFSIEESSNLASDAMQRAADVASIMGIDTASAMEAITGAAKGNFDMMDNLGVAMNDTTLNAYAMSKGIDKTTQEMTNQEKIGLAMEMFMEKTAYAAGNYAKENETLAGSLGTAKSALTNFLDGSGDVDQLVGAFSNAADVIVRNLKEIAPRLVSGLTEIVEQIIPIIPPLLQQLLPTIIDGAMSMVSGLVAVLPSILNMLTTSLLPQLISAMGTIFNILVMTLPQLMQSFVSILPTLLPQLINGLVSMIVTLCTNFNQIIQPLIVYLPQILVAVIDALIQNLPILIEGAVQLVVGIVQALPEIILALVQAMPTVIMSLIDGLLGAAPLLIGGWKQIWNSVSMAVINVVTGLAKTVVGWVITLKDKAVTKFNELKTNAVEKITALKDGVVEKFNSVKSKVTEIFNNVKKAITEPIENARDTVKGIIDKIVGFFTGAKFEWPKIKMPKFAVSPSGWKIGDLLKGSIPKLSIKWNADAMRNPMIMNEPTIFGYNPATGTLMGGGEAGSEVVSGTATLLNMIQQAVRAENSATAMQLTRIIDLLVQFFPDALDAMRTPMMFDTNGAVLAMAPGMNAALGQIAIQKGRGR